MSEKLIDDAVSNTVGDENDCVIEITKDCDTKTEECVDCINNGVCINKSPNVSVDKIAYENNLDLTCLEQLSDDDDVDLTCLEQLSDDDVDLTCLEQLSDDDVDLTCNKNSNPSNHKNESNQSPDDSSVFRMMRRRRRRNKHEEK
jgi:hypothetical protein